MASINLSFWLLQTIAMIITCLLTPGLSLSNPLGAVAAVVALAFVNANIWDAALFFQVPNSLGIHSAVLLISNAVIFWTVIKILPWIQIHGCLPAIIAPVIFTITSLLLRNSGDYINWSKVDSKAGSAVHDLKDYLHQTPAGRPTPAPTA
jgi:uncharacterized membrane protein YvlD (DUF360 family)